MKVLYHLHACVLLVWLYFSVYILWLKRPQRTKNDNFSYYWFCHLPQIFVVTIDSQYQLCAYESPVT